MNLFAYGTLQFEGVWRAVVGGAPPASAPAVAPGFTVRRVRDALYPGAFKAEGGEAPGVVYFDVPPETLGVLDRFEGGQYTRETIAVRLAGGEAIRCEAYLAKPTEVADEPWTAENFAARGDLRRFLSRCGISLE